MILVFFILEKMLSVTLTELTHKHHMWITTIHISKWHVVFRYFMLLFTLFHFTFCDFFVCVNYFICLISFKLACRGTCFLCLFQLFSFFAKNTFTGLIFVVKKKWVCFWWIVTRIVQIILTYTMFWSTETHKKYTPGATQRK